MISVASDPIDLNAFQSHLCYTDLCVVNNTFFSKLEKISGLEVKKGKINMFFKNPVEI